MSCALADTGLVINRLGDGPEARAKYPWRPVRRGLFRAAILLEVAGGHRYRDAGGDAVLWLRPPRLSLRFGAVMVGFVAVGAGLVGASYMLWWPLTAAVYLAAVGLVVLPAWNHVRNHSSKNALATAKPEQEWMLHSFVSRRAGAGRRLLDRVCDEADVAKRVIYLDCDPKLIAYYQASGFVADVEVPMRWASQRASTCRMVRIPLPLD